MSQYPIDSNVPIPKDWFEPKYPWEQLEVGQSFLIPKEESALPRTVSTHAKRKGRKLDRKFVVRSTPDGIRVWRTE